MAEEITTIPEWVDGITPLVAKHNTIIKQGVIWTVNLKVEANSPVHNYLKNYSETNDLLLANTDIQFPKRIGDKNINFIQYKRPFSNQQQIDNFLTALDSLQTNGNCSLGPNDEISFTDNNGANVTQELCKTREALTTWLNSKTGV